MKAIIQAFFQHFSAKLALTCCCLGFCCPCMAQIWLSQSLNTNTKLEFMPIALMDDATLISAAEMRRDSRMNHSTRMLNSHWLIQNKYNTFFGETAINQFLKAGFKSLWNSRTNTKPSKYTYASMEDITFIGNYALDLSEEHILVGVRFRF